MNRLDEIRARLDAATPGPWFTDGIASVGTKPFRGIRRFAQYHVAKTFRSNPDADLISHAPTDLRDLLAVAEAAYRVLQSYEREDVLTAGLGTVAIEQLDAALARLDACVCGAQLEDGVCRSDHHMDFAVTDVTT